MNILRRHWLDVGRADKYSLYPLGDVHLGAAACDEKAFRAVVNRIAADERAYWVGLGDYCDFINVSDPRFSAGSLAPWIKMADLGDLARAQRDRFLEIVEPIAPRCLGLIEGNHELSIKRYYERDIYSDIVCGVKELGGFAADHSLALGYYGWLLLSFYRAPEKRRETLYKINLHHGFTGGRLAGAKALNMQRWLWTHDADLVIFGHSHNTGAQAEAVETITRGGHVSHITRRGCYGGTFLATNAEGGSTYSEVKGYFPLPVTQPMISLRPGAADKMDRLRVVT